MHPELRKLFSISLPVVALLLQACAAKSLQTELPPPVEQQRITQLNRAILALRDDVDPSEAQRAARIAIKYSQQLAREYQVSSSPLVHNLLVNLGMKPRGLCVDWTSDLLSRLRQEGFYSLDLHWGIANYEFAFRIEHSTAIISARGDSLQRGLVLDPWRNSGQLYWAATLEDPEYKWHPQAKIHALKKEQAASSEH